MASHVKETVRWRNSAESLVVFLIYMYCVLNGWIVQLVVFISVIKLTLNYLHIRYISNHNVLCLVLSP
jgi:hypothetical protein